MDKTTWQHYCQTHETYTRQKYPNVPADKIPKPKPIKETANSITTAIINYLKWTGNHGERVNVMGRQIYDKRRGRTLWIKSSGRKGSADIHAIIQGRAVMIEVKAGKDRQRVAQLTYENDINRAGGVYIIVHSFDEFLEWFQNFKN